MIDYRLVSLDEEREFYNLTLYAFNRSDTDSRRKFFHQLFVNSNAYGALDGGDIQSGFLSIPFTAQLGGDQYKTQGISYVSSYPESSGHGNVKHLMGKYFQDAIDNEVDISYLAPFSFPFYRQYGYEEVFDLIEYRHQNIDLPKIKMPDYCENRDIRVERIELSEALPLIQSYHNKHSYNCGGGVLREDWWNEYLVMKRPWEAAICKVDGTFLGYIIFTRHQNVEFEIQEIFYTSKAALWGLLRFVGQYRTAYKYFDYLSGNPVPRADIFPDPHEKKTLTVSSKPYMMARIINLKSFLKKYHVADEVNDEFTLKVTDDFLPINNKNWKIKIQKGNIAITVTSDTATIATISIQRLTQILFGYRKPDEILDLELSNDAIEHLNNLRKKQLIPMFWDYF